MSRRRVAILGAGIMGCSVAIQLARRGFDVTVFDREPAPMAAASRWNEGKIHLGYIYGADPTLATAQHLLTGGLLFEDRLRELIDADLTEHVTADDDIYLVHRDSVVGPEILRPKFDAISALVREHPDASRYLVDVSDARDRGDRPRRIADPRRRRHRRGIPGPRALGGNPVGRGSPGHSRGGDVGGDVAARHGRRRGGGGRRCDR